jgi:hypothetical protein
MQNCNTPPNQQYLIPVWQKVPVTTGMTQDTGEASHPHDRSRPAALAGCSAPNLATGIGCQVVSPKPWQLHKVYWRDYVTTQAPIKAAPWTLVITQPHLPSRHRPSAGPAYSSAANRGLSQLQVTPGQPARLARGTRRAALLAAYLWLPSVVAPQLPFCGSTQPVPLCGPRVMLSQLKVLQGLQGGVWTLVGLASRHKLPLGLTQALVLLAAGCSWLRGTGDACIRPVAGWPRLRLLLLWLLEPPTSSSASEKSAASKAYGSSSWKPLQDRVAKPVQLMSTGCPALPTARPAAGTGSWAAEA